MHTAAAVYESGNTLLSFHSTASVQQLDHEGSLHSRPPRLRFFAARRRHSDRRCAPLGINVSGKNTDWTLIRVVVGDDLAARDIGNHVSTGEYRPASEVRSELEDVERRRD